MFDFIKKFLTKEVEIHKVEAEKIGEWFKELSDIAAVHPHLEFIIPLHPNPNVQKHKDKLGSWVKIIEPMDHEDLIKLLVKTRLVITDSGGIQEECSFFNKKALVCRKITERPESVGLSSFMVESSKELKGLFDEHINDYEVDIVSPYGDGASSKRITKLFKDENI